MEKEEMIWKLKSSSKLKEFVGEYLAASQKLLENLLKVYERVSKIYDNYSESMATISKEWILNSRIMLN